MVAVKHQAARELLTLHLEDGQLMDFYVKTTRGPDDGIGITVTGGLRQP